MLPCSFDLALYRRQRIKRQWRESKNLSTFAAMLGLLYEDWRSLRLMGWIRYHLHRLRNVILKIRIFEWVGEEIRYQKVIREMRKEQLSRKDAR